MIHPQDLMTDTALYRFHEYEVTQLEGVEDTVDLNPKEALLSSAAIDPDKTYELTLDERLDLAMTVWRLENE